MRLLFNKYCILTNGEMWYKVMSPPMFVGHIVVPGLFFGWEPNRDKVLRDIEEHLQYHGLIE